jgi:type II secretion system-associated lipoprotein
MQRFLLLVLLFLLSGCTSFIKEEQVARVKEYEYYIFTLKEDVIIDNELRLKAGTDVRLYIVTSNDFIKAYVYPADASYLKSDHQLLLYLFEEDFSDKKFNQSSFNTKLFSLVERKQKTDKIPGDEPVDYLN